MEKLHWIFFLCFGCLSVYNFLKEIENGSRLNQFEKKADSISSSFGRHRRDTAESNGEKEEVFNFFKLAKLKEFVQQTANETFRKEAEAIFTRLILNFPIKRVCKNILVKCEKDCESENENDEAEIISDDVTTKGDGKCIRGPMGPPGKAGPPGRTGPPGPGIRSPKLVESILNHTVQENSSVDFKCVFFGNPIPKSVEWQYQANHSKLFDSIDIKKSQITSRLRLTNISWADRGRVMCRSKTFFGEDNGSGNLNVFSRPIILINTTLVFAYQGTNFKLPECRVRSFPTANITWKRIFWPLPADRSVVNDGLLSISRVEYKDEGYYVCEAINKFGKTSHTVQLKTKALQMLNRPPSVITLLQNQVYNITCSAYGNAGEMTGTVASPNNPHMTFEVVREENLFLMQARVEKSGTYICTIKSKINQVQSFSTINVFSLQSTTLTTQQKLLIGSWLEESSAVGEYKLCWSSSMHGYSAFHQNCDGKPHTITIARVSNKNEIFGGYTDVAWKRNGQPGYSANTFIFNLQTNRKFDIKNKAGAVCQDTYAPCFGSNELYFSHNFYRYNNYFIINLSSYLTGHSLNGERVSVEVFYKV